MVPGLISRANRETSGGLVRGAQRRPAPAERSSEVGDGKGIRVILEWRNDRTARKKTMSVMSMVGKSRGAGGVMAAVGIADTGHRAVSCVRSCTNVALATAATAAARSVRVVDVKEANLAYHHSAVFAGNHLGLERHKVGERH